MLEANIGDIGPWYSFPGNLIHGVCAEDSDIPFKTASGCLWDLLRITGIALHITLKR